MNLSKIKIRTYQFLFYSSMIGFVLTIPILGRCETLNYSYGDFAYDYWWSVAIPSFFLLLGSLFIYTTDNTRLGFRKLLGKRVIAAELYNFLSAILLGMFWFIIVGTLSENGSCDLITGPAETGTTLALMVSAGINFWKIRIIKSKY